MATALGLFGSCANLVYILFKLGTMQHIMGSLYLHPVLWQTGVTGIMCSDSSSEYGTTDIEEDDDDSEDISEGVIDALGTGMSGKHPSY